MRRQYWHPINAPAVRFSSNREYEEALLEIFDAAVKARLRTAGKVGSQLSGGMDSSSVTAAAARLLGSEGLAAFTAVPQQGFADENPVGRFGNEGAGSRSQTGCHVSQHRPRARRSIRRRPDAASLRTRASSMTCLSSIR